METNERLPDDLLCKKAAVVAFIKDDVVEVFEAAFAKGRNYWNTWTIHPTRSYNDKSVLELLDLTRAAFSAIDNPFYPYFTVILDSRTAEDASVLVIHRDPLFPGDHDILPPYWELGLSAESLACFLSIASIGHTTIEDVILNDGYEDESIKNTYIYDVPFNHSESTNQKNVRVPRAEFKLSKNSERDFTTLHLPAANVEAKGLPAVGVKLSWFGEVPETILLLSSGSEMDASEVHVVGEKV